MDLAQSQFIKKSGHSVKLYFKLIFMLSWEPRLNFNYVFIFFFINPYLRSKRIHFCNTDKAHDREIRDMLMMWWFITDSHLTSFSSPKKKFYNNTTHLAEEWQCDTWTRSGSSSNRWVADNDSYNTILWSQVGTEYMYAVRHVCQVGKAANYSWFPAHFTRFN